MHLTHEICHLFLRVMCQLYHVLITCYPRKTWTQIARAQIRKLLLSFVLLLVYRICGMQRRGTAFKKIGTMQVASTPCDLSNSGARGWTNFKRNILYAIRSINGVEINRSVCIHAQTARRCRTRSVHSSIHTATPTRRVPFASTENTSRCGLSIDIK